MPVPEPAPDLAAITPRFEEIVREAGAIALGFFRNGAKRWSKADRSPVTEGDIAVDRFLNTALPPLLPGSGWLSEESADTPDRLERRHVWIVDPIDGTRAFADGVPAWVVSVALVEHGRPVLAAIFNPVAGEFYAARAGQGARLNGAPILARQPDSLAGAVLCGPQAIVGALAGTGAVAGPWVYALAYRLAQVADARFDAAFARANPRDWDVAAADLILAEAGAVLTDIHGESLLYNRALSSHPPLIACGRSIHAALVAALSQHPPHLFDKART